MQNNYKALFDILGLGIDGILNSCENLGLPAGAIAANATVIVRLNQQILDDMM